VRLPVHESPAPKNDAQNIQKLIGIRRATFDRCNNDDLMVMVQFIKDTKITKPPTKTAATAPQKFNIPVAGPSFGRWYCC
jgi:hypothetical protein